MRAYIEGTIVMLVIWGGAKVLQKALTVVPGLTFELAGATISLTMLAAALALVAGSFLAGDERLGPLKICVLVPAVFVAWIPVMTELAQRAAGIDAEFGPMPYQAVPLIAELWFQAIVFAILATPASVLVWVERR